MTSFRGLSTLAVVITCAMATMAWATVPVFDYQFPASYDGTTTTCVDLSTAGNDATVDSLTGYAAGVVPPGFSTALGSLHGTNQGTAATDSTQLLLNSAVAANGGFTYDAWVKPTGTSQSTYIIDYAGTETLRLTYDSTADEYKLQFRARAGYWNVNSDPIELDKWYHVRVSFDAVGLPTFSNGYQPGVGVMVVEDPVAGTTDTKWNGMVKTDYGDGLNRAIGLNRKSDKLRDVNPGYLFNPKVNLGPDPTIDAVGLIPDPTSTGGMVAHWALDDLNSGLPTVVDSGPNGLNGTAEGSAGAVVMERPGARPFTGTAAGFNLGAATNNGQVKVPYDAKLNTESFSVAFWMNAESAHMDNWMGLIDNRDTGAGFTVYTGPDQQLYAAISGGVGGTSWARCLGVIAGDTWTHIALTYDADTDVGRLYMDGGLTSLVTVPDYVPNDDKNFYIGRLGTAGGYPLFGDMDDVRLYDYALTEEEVAGLIIPEPGTLVLLLGALAGLVALRNRR